MTTEGITEHIPGPLTPAAQLLRTRIVQNAISDIDLQPALIEGADNIPAVDTFLEEYDAASESLVEPYDYERDGVAFETKEYESAQPLDAFAHWAGRGALIPSGELGYSEEGDRFRFILSLEGQKFAVTARNAITQVTEVAKESGSALKESFKESFAVEEPKFTKEVVAAVSILCGQLIIQYSEKLETNSIFDLRREIRKKYKDLTNDPLFSSSLKHFCKKPNEMKESFSHFDYTAALEEMALLPEEFHEFIDKHGINPKELLGELL